MSETSGELIGIEDGVWYMLDALGNFVEVS